MNETVVWFLLFASALSGVLCLVLTFQLRYTLRNLFQNYNEQIRILDSLSNSIKTLSDVSGKLNDSLTSLIHTSGQSLHENKADHDRFQQTFRDLIKENKSNHDRISTQLGDIARQLPPEYHPPQRHSYSTGGHTENYARPRY